MTTTPMVSGPLTAIAYGKETTSGTQVPPTNWLFASGGKFEDNPDILKFEVAAGSRDPVHQTRPSVHKVTGQLDSFLYGLQLGPMFAASIGSDTLFPLTAGATLSAATVVGATSVSLATPPALPTGITEWTGLWIDIDTGANKERKYILASTGTSPVVCTVTPLAFAHASAATVSVPAQHVIQPYASNSANAGFLQSLSLYCQFGRQFEWQIPYSLIDKFDIKVDNREIKTNFDFKAQALPVDVTGSNMALWAASGTYANAGYSANENNDAPFTAFDGGLISNFLSTDTTPTVHSRATAVDYTFMNGLIAKQFSGGVQLTENYIPGKRSQTIKFKEEFGTANGDADMYTSYVKSQTSLPAYMAFLNSVTSNAIGLWFPTCKVVNYNPTWSLNDAVGFDGELIPLFDQVSGRSVKMSICNGTTVAY